MKSRKIWVGVGTFIMVGGAVGAGNAPAATPAVSVRTLERASPGIPMPRLPASNLILAQHHGGGEEGGAGGEEGGEGGVGSLPPDLALAVRVALMRGHLLIGDDLVQQKQWAAALPHFLHPAEEIYPGMAEQLDGYRIAPFEKQLKALSDVVKARKGGADYKRTRAAVDSALDVADARLKDKQSANWAGFEIEAAVELLKIAGSEYGSSIEKGKFVKVVEYQDARGFILHAEQMVEAVAADLEKKDAAALKQVRASLVELKKGFPKAVPPKTPVQDTATVLSAISRIELAAGRLF